MFILLIVVAFSFDYVLIFLGENWPLLSLYKGLNHVICFKDPNVRLIRELRAEIDRLKILLQAHGQVRNPGKK